MRFLDRTPFVLSNLLFLSYLEYVIGGGGVVVVAGITISDAISVSHIGQQLIQKYRKAMYQTPPSTLWYTLVHSGILWYTLVHSGILWYTLVYSGIL